MRRTLLVTALLAGLALPATADGATRWVVRGAGFGHGIGMSQYGAYGFAVNGSGYRDILRHYYSGTEIGSASGRTIRVLLGDGRGSVRFDRARSVGGKRLGSRTTYTARSTSGGVRITGGGRTIGTFAAPAIVRGDAIRFVGTTMNGVSNGRFRTSLELRPSSSGGLTVVNALGLDDYVRGVISGEVPPSWPAEALKAQSIAARTYAITTDRGGPVFDQYPDTRSQVYRGMSGETPTTNAAVSATAGEIVTYEGNAVVTYFFSTSGGKTENVENVFYGAVPSPWLRGVDDPHDDASPRHRWRLVFTSSQMQSRLAGLVKGSFRGVKVVERGVSPRIVWADVIGSRGRTRVRGATLRARLGLYDTWASFKKVTGESAKRYRPAPPQPRPTSTSLQSSGWLPSSPATSPESSREGLLRWLG